MIDMYVKEDGSVDEGVGYWSNSFRSTMPALAALARHRGKPLEDMIPGKLHLMWNYIGSLVSTVGKPGSYLPISDTVGNQIALDAVSLLATALGTGGWTGLLGACLAAGTKPRYDWSFDGPFAIIFGPDDCPEPKVEVPVFSHLKTLGMLTSNRPWKEGSVRLHLVGAVADAGHSHADKGSFILEAMGELFAAAHPC